MAKADSKKKATSKKGANKKDPPKQRVRVPAGSRPLGPQRRPLGVGDSVRRRPPIVPGSGMRASLEPLGPQIKRLLGQSARALRTAGLRSPAIAAGIYLGETIGEPVAKLLSGQYTRGSTGEGLATLENILNLNEEIVELTAIVQDENARGFERSAAQRNLEMILPAYERMVADFQAMDSDDLDEPTVSTDPEPDDPQPDPQPAPQPAPQPDPQPDPQLDPPPDPRSDPRPAPQPAPQEPNVTRPSISDVDDPIRDILERLKAERAARELADIGEGEFADINRQTEMMMMEAAPQEDIGDTLVRQQDYAGEFAPSIEDLEQAKREPLGETAGRLAIQGFMQRNFGFRPEVTFDVEEQEPGGSGSMF